MKRVRNIGPLYICVQERRDFIFAIAEQSFVATCTPTHVHGNRCEKKSRVRVKRKRKIAGARGRLRRLDCDFARIETRKKKSRRFRQSASSRFLVAPNKHLDLGREEKNYRQRLYASDIRSNATKLFAALLRSACRFSRDLLSPFRLSLISNADYFNLKYNCYLNGKKILEFKSCEKSSVISENSTIKEEQYTMQFSRAHNNALLIIDILE